VKFVLMTPIFDLRERLCVSCWQCKMLKVLLNVNKQCLRFIW